MKRAILLAVAVLALTSIRVEAAYYRTQIIFFNRAPAFEIDEPIKMPDGTGPGDRCGAQLCWVLENGSVQPIGQIGRFYNLTEESRFYVTSPAMSAVIERYPFPEGSVDAVIRLRLRVWEGAAWETARIRGESADWDHIVHPLGTMTSPPMIPEMPVNFRGFTLTERPQLAAAAVAGDGAMNLAINTEFQLPRAKVTVLKSSDLINWEEAGAVPVVNGSLQVPTAAARALNATPREYYRIKLE